MITVAVVSVCWSYELYARSVLLWGVGFAATPEDVFPKAEVQVAALGLLSHGIYALRFRV